jgi:hypothetical protein
MQYNFG